MSWRGGAGRERQPRAPAKDALAAFDTDGMHWAKGNLRFDLSFALQIMTPAAATPLSFTVRITRLRAK